MELTIRSQLTAAAVLAAGSLIAVTPAVTPSLPDVQTRATQLASSASDLTDAATNIVQAMPAQALDSVLAQLQTQELAQDAALLSQLATINGTTVTTELNFEQVIAGPLADFPGTLSSTDILGGTLNSLYDGYGTATTSLEATLLGSIGADYDPATLTSSALIPTADLPAVAGGVLPFQDGAIGGLWGTVDNALYSEAQLLPEEGQNIDNLTGSTGSVFSIPSLADFQALDAAQTTAYADLLSGETTFNADLLGNEMASVDAAFGANTTLDPFLDRLFNADNLLVELFENSFNSVIGADNISPATLVGQLLIATPSDGGYFDGVGTSSIGGLTGVLDQSLAALNDASSLTLADYTSAFASFDPAAFDTAVSSLIDPTAFTADFSAFTNELPTVLSDLSTIVTSFF